MNIGFFTKLAIIPVFILNLSATSVLAAESLTITSQQDQYILGPYLDYLEDVDNRWAVDDVDTPPLALKFNPANRDVPYFGFSGSSYWLRLRIHSEEVAPKEMIPEPA